MAGDWSERRLNAGCSVYSPVGNGCNSLERDGTSIRKVLTARRVVQEQKLGAAIVKYSEGKENQFTVPSRNVNVTLVHSNYSRGRGLSVYMRETLCKLVQLYY